MKNETINRGKFLKDLGLSTAAIMSLYCMGTVTACKSESAPSPTPSPSTGTTTGTSTKTDFTLDLSTADYSKLKTTGNFVYKDGVIVANAGGTFIALSKACTHEGSTVDYRSANNDIHCSNHGSLFNIDGSNKLGPATSPLKQYKTELSTDGNKLKVFE